MEYKINYQMLEAIEKALAKGDRVEIIPRKDGVVINRIRREQIKTN